MSAGRADVLILGAGFSGSLLAAILARGGRRVVLVDRQAHPRFAIGESSTPLADLLLRELATRHDLPWLAPLSHYGSWCDTYPEVGRGPKRGFSYFLHRPGRPFAADQEHSTELLVAASERREVADTHWLRADVDQFLARRAVAEGATLIESVELTPVGRAPWRWQGRRIGRPAGEMRVEASFVVDASGPSGALAQLVGATDQTARLQTRSRALYTHLTGICHWEEMLDELRVDRSAYPYPCDEAAVHHLLDEGWMWQLWFDQGVCSVGFAIEDCAGAYSTAAPEEQWRSLLGRYPSLRRQLADGQIVDPPARIRSTGRLQRCWSPASGDDWALLPAAAGFIDPWHSTGIAHSLFGVARVAAALSAERPEARAAALDEHNRAVAAELSLVDELVSACYATRRDFPLFVAASTLYFVAAIDCERRRLAGESTWFLSADNASLGAVLRQLARRLRDTNIDPQPLIAEVRSRLAPWNQAGLLDPAARNLYRRTALPAS